VAERRRPPEFVPTITVNDRPIAISAAGLSSTVITLGRPEPGLPPDLQFRQTSESTVHITTPTRSIDVALVAFRQEQAFMGLRGCRRWSSMSNSQMKCPTHVQLDISVRKLE
jgi:hypothetical protein